MKCVCDTETLISLKVWRSKAWRHNKSRNWAALKTITKKSCSMGTHRSSEIGQTWLYSRNRERCNKFLSSRNTDATNEISSTGSMVMGTDSKPVSCKYEKLLMQASPTTNCYCLFNCMAWLPHVFIFLLAFLKAGWRDMKRIANPVPLPLEILQKSEREGSHSWFFHLAPNSSVRWNSS